MHTHPASRMIEFRALGPAELMGPEGADIRAVLARPKLLGVLAFLTVGEGRGFQRRDSLMGVFWAELSQDRARSTSEELSLYGSTNLGSTSGAGKGGPANNPS